MPYQSFNPEKVEYIDYITNCKNDQRSGIYRVHYKLAKASRPYFESSMTPKQYENTIGKFMKRADLMGEYIEYEVEEHGFYVEPVKLHQIYRINEEK